MSDIILYFCIKITHITVFFGPVAQQLGSVDLGRTGTST